MRAVAKHEPDSGMLGSGAGADRLAPAASAAPATPAPGGRADGRVSRAQRLRQERSTQIQVVARTLFARRGYHETTIQDILDGAGIARGTFYLHFDSKRAI